MYFLWKQLEQGQQKQIYRIRNLPPHRENNKLRAFLQNIYFSVFKSNPSHINIPESNAHGFSREKNRERKYEKKKNFAARGGNILLNHHL